MLTSVVDNAEEATKHLKVFMGDYYRYSNESAISAFINNRISRCMYVDDEGMSCRALSARSY